MHAYVGYLTIGLGGLNVPDMAAALFFFLVLLGLLKKFAWGPLLEIMEEREQRVANDIDQAERDRIEAAKSVEAAQAQLLQTKQDAKQIIEDAKVAGAKREEEIVEAAEQESERMIQAALAEIQLEKEEAILELQEKVGALSVLIASKVIEKEVTVEDQEEMINNYAKELGDA